MKSPLAPLAVALLTAAVSFASNAPVFRFNTIGYVPDTPKHATVPGADAAHAFAVIRASDGTVVLRGTVGAARSDRDTRESLAELDFSALRTPGEYRLQLGATASPPFRIGPDVFREPFVLVSRAMYLWRCGMAVDADWQGHHFHHDACHLDDAWLDYVTGRHERLPTTGGWHDAGDYNKYVPNAGYTIGLMLRAWEDFPAIRALGLNLPESGGPLPDFLAEIKYETDWLLTMQAPDGSVYLKVSTDFFGAFVRPEAETTPRYVCPGGSTSTADFAAALAQAARAFRPYAPAYADRCLAAARGAHAWLLAHPQYVRADQSKFHTGNYDSPDPDDRLWAAAELWETTGDPALLAELERRVQSMGTKWDPNPGWAEVKDLGLLTYLRSARPDRDRQLVTSTLTGLLTTSDTIVAKARASGYARPLGSLYYWGCNGSVAEQTLLLLAAHRFTTRPVYRNTALDALDHLLGRNVHGRSYVTGLGFDPPQHPHDRRSEGDKGEPAWPGYLVGGPHPTAHDWQDNWKDASRNEIALNWNGALIYALAAFVQPATPAAHP